MVATTHATFHMGQSRSFQELLIQQQQGRTVVASQALRADSAGDNLMATLTTNTCLIVDALGGRCNEASAGALVASRNAIR